MNRIVTTENLAIFVIVVVGMFVVVLMDRMGEPQKWHAAVAGTAISFGGVALVYQRKWPHWSFWVSLGTCFAAHILALWLVFDRLLAPVKTMGILIWSPIAFAEGIFLLGFVPVLERKLRHKKH